MLIAQPVSNTSGKPIFSLGVSQVYSETPGVPESWKAGDLEQGGRGTVFLEISGLLLGVF